MFAYFWNTNVSIMAIIKIERKSRYINAMRNYKIYIDEQQVGTIANGETKEFETTAGEHTVVAKIDWCSSPLRLLDLKQDEVKMMSVDGFKNSSWIMRIAGLLIVLHFILKLTMNVDYTIYLLIPALLLLGYYITIGRTKYLSLTEL